MIYPEYIEADGHRYKLNTSYLVALDCFKIINDDEIEDTERAMALMQKLIGTVVLDESTEKILTLLVRYLQRGKTKEEMQNIQAIVGDEDPDIDYETDIGYITASFISDYQIDLSDSKNDNMHWWKFVDLLNGVNPKSAIGRVREIRNMKLSDYKDPKTREAIIKAKQLVAIPEKLTPEEQAADDEFMRRLKGEL